MEINRILFGQLNNGKIDKSFDDLDVNHDSVINDEDLSLSADYLVSMLKNISEERDSDENNLYHYC